MPKGQTTEPRRPGYLIIAENRTIAAGGLRPVKIGRAVRIPETEIDAFINDLMEASQ